MDDFNLDATTPVHNGLVPASRSDRSRFGYLFDLSPLGAMVTNADNQIVYVNPAFERLTGYAARDAVGLSPSVLGSGRHGEDFYCSMWNALSVAGCWQGEIWNRRRDATLFAAVLTINRLVDAQSGSVSYLGLYLDITQKKQREDLLAYEASHDLLTGLANNTCMRRHLDRVLVQARTHLRSIAVLYIDLDGFKMINDSCGHQGGDSVLKSFARKLQSSVRETDFVARVGGDEFVVVLDMMGKTEEAAFEVAEKILATLKAPLEDELPVAQVGCSIGISIFPCSGESVSELINAADKAMYRIKRQGGGYLFNLTSNWLKKDPRGDTFFGRDNTAAPPRLYYM